jgi:hypothetical protein
LQAGVDPGALADCAVRYPEVFHCWMEQLEAQDEAERSVVGAQRRRRLLETLRAKLGMRG